MCIYTWDLSVVLCGCKISHSYHIYTHNNNLHNITGTKMQIIPANNNTQLIKIDKSQDKKNRTRTPEKNNGSSPYLGIFHNQITLKNPKYRLQSLPP